MDPQLLAIRVMTKFMINNRTDSLKTKLRSIWYFLMITNCQIVHSHSLMPCINYKFMCLSAIHNEN